MEEQQCMMSNHSAILALLMKKKEKGKKYSLLFMKVWSFDRCYICLCKKNKKKKLLIPAEIKGWFPYYSLGSDNEGCFLPGVCSSRVYRYSVRMVSVCCLMLHLPVKKIEDELIPSPLHYLYICICVTL